VVHGFEGSGEVVVSSEAGVGADLRVSFRVNQPVEGLGWDRKGTFLLRAETDGERSDARLVRIESWDQLRRRRTDSPETQIFGLTVISGATVSSAGGLSP
jgi:hypothetical protein